ncbi:hemolysin III family protein [Aliiroseovarius sp. KMU-50]|uniref:Hemolysin III family protein n=1 Tax=Aliiroseovarius salicola TaxID=3009082 RepID=A0ABT4W1F0_9RHOB|nr:hemolysin III family protein [Aliiroseovarius sp. KMU-50]MDA5094325.1 hemolysin III family protein [Aliiroseovarius sp. KMU-50]
MEFGEEFTIKEYIADGVIHGLGVLAAFAGATALVVWAAHSGPMGHLPLVAIYAVGLIASFLLSAAYNMTLHREARSVLRRFDHAAIFFLIASTYTPLALVGIGGTNGLALNLAAWTIALVGITLKLFFFGRFERFTFQLMLMQGWLAVLAIGPLIANFSLAILILLVGGGVLFTLGTLFHVRDHLPFNRAIWHSHVLAGAAMHYTAVFMILRG